MTMNTVRQLQTPIILILVGMVHHNTRAMYPMGSRYSITARHTAGIEIESQSPEYNQMSHVHGDPGHMLGLVPHSDSYTGDPIVLEGVQMNFQNNPMLLGDTAYGQMNVQSHMNPLGDRTHTSSYVNLPRNPMAMNGIPNQMVYGSTGTNAGNYQPAGFTSPRERLTKHQFLQGLLGNSLTGSRPDNTITRMSSTLQDIGKLMGKNDQSWMNSVRGYFKKMLAQKKLIQQQEQMRQQQLQQQLQMRRQQIQHQQIQRQRILLDM